MSTTLSERHEQLLRRLLAHRGGLTIDALAADLGIARTAVRQHLASLERDGHVQPGRLQKTNGRPVRTYRISDQGIDLFPKQYAWFSSLMLDAVRRERGPEGLAVWLEDLAHMVAQGLTPRGQVPDFASRVRQATHHMAQLHYEATVESVAESQAVVAATNCVFHAIAATTPEVCRFDLALLADLSGASVSHESCMITGDSACRFRLTAPTAGGAG